MVLRSTRITQARSTDTSELSYLLRLASQNSSGSRTCFTGGQELRQSSARSLMANLRVCLGNTCNASRPTKFLTSFQSLVCGSRLLPRPACARPVQKTLDKEDFTRRPTRSSATRLPQNLQHIVVPHLRTDVPVICLLLS